MMFPKFFRIGLVTCFLSLLSLHPIWADDTEIFYNSASLAGVQPNLLFVLDASNSMDWYDCQDGTAKQKNSCDDGTPNGTNSRRDRMVEAMKLVLDNTKGVNVGMMRLGGFGGARMMYPVRDIDSNACLNGVCDENTIFDVRSVVSSSDDDIFVTGTDHGEEIKSDAQKLQLAAGDSDDFTALRFQNLVIPKGATIEDARILFTAAEHKNVKTDLKLAIEQTDHAGPFINGDDDNNVGDRDWDSDVEWPAVKSWVKDRIYESPNISTLIQQVVDEDDWCGSNAVALSVTGTGDRIARTYDRSASQAPLLKVRFRLDNIPSSGGCTTTTKTFLLNQDYADGTEDQFGVVNLTNDYMLMKDNVLSGIQFLDVAIDPDAKIRRANLTIKTAWGNANNKGAMDGELWMEDSGDPDPFALSQFNLSSRTDTDKVSWSVREINGTAMTSPDISSLVQDVISNDDWKSGNSMSFFFNRAGGDADSLRSFYTFNKSKLNAPRLTISYQTTARTALDMEGTVRTKLKNQLDDFETILGTPTVGALEEAWRYYAGEPVKHGVKRPFVRWHANQWFSRVSHPETYTGGTVKRSEYCHDAHLNSEHCESEEILGNPVYTSPIEAECQSNYIVLLTDGAPWVGDDTEREPDYSDTIAKIQGMNGGACVGTPGAHSLCGEELSKYMFENDVASHITGDQTIITHSIGFNIKNDWIKDVATAGGGSYYSAESSLELFEAISDIVSKVSSAGTTFVAPAATIDQFSRIAHRKEVYLALFKPQNSASWRGNLKKYDFTGSPPLLRGVDGIPAIEPETGKFLPGSQSYWATEADGADITDGGAASHLDPSTRKIVTHLDPGNFDLFSLSNAISTADSSLLTAAMIGANDDNEFGVLVDWLAGFDVKDENKDNNIFDRRNHIGDPLHTNPVVVTYAAEPGQTPDPENPNSLVFFGTNEGFLHAINTIDGTEEFAFMPPELLSNVPKLFANNPTARNESKPYGLDGDITLWTSDANNNGIIEAADNDKAILYIGMRRGGNRYYAIDVSDRTNPKYIRKLEGGAGDYAELGQTWSKPIITKVKVGSEVKTVAVFGGGYDPSQDDNTERKEDSIGRAIYFTDIETGELVWSGGNPATQSALSDKHQPFANMNYSIPSDLAIVKDPNSGYLSQIYVGDMGGRLWRFDINNGSSITELVSGGIIADFAEDDNPKGTRRFYNKPDLSISRVNGRRMINIAIGSGYRAHPLNRIIEDKFFLFKYPYKSHDDSNYGVKIPGTTSYRHATLDDLYDTTENLIIEGDTIDIIDQAKEDLAAAEGWYITMDLPGEKILAPSNTLDGILRFVSYAPMQTQGVCDPNIGKSFYWAINLSDGAPAARTNNDNPDLEKEYRKKETPGLGLAPPISTIFVEHEGTVTPTDVSGVNTLHEWNDIELQRRWFWSEQPD